MALTPIYYPDAGGPTGFNLTDYTDPLTYVAWCNYVISENIKKMEEEGLQWSDGASDLETAWTDQTTTLNQQSALFDALEDSENLDTAWKTRLSSAKAQVTTLLALAQTQQNLDVRNAAITIFESLFNSVAGASSPADPETESDLIEVLKAAFLEETVPGSGVYLTTTLEQLKDILQAVQDLKYNDEILEIPAAPRPIRIHLQSKTIQT